jgi:hypothetical protein
MWLRISYLLMVALLGASAPLGAAEPPTAEARAWARLEPGTTFRLGERRIEVGAAGLAAWKRARLGSALGMVSIASPSRPLVERATAAVAALQDDELVFERALLAASVAEGVVGSQVAVELDGLLARLAREGARGGSPSQELVRGLLAAEGLLASLLDARCMPSSAADLAALEPWRELELAIPSHRLASRREQPDAASLPPTSRQPALLAFAIAVAALHGLQMPALPATFEPGCDLARVRFVASLAGAGPEQWSRDSDGFEAVAATWGIPTAWLQRMASVAYLRGDGPLLALLARTAPARSPVRALAFGAGKEFTSMATAVTAGLDGPPGLVGWCEAESLRHAGKAPAAVAKASEALATDGAHAGALLTRAVSRLAAGAEEEALADLAHMRLLYEEHPVYGGWVDRLARRLDPGAIPAGEIEEESP